MTIEKKGGYSGSKPASKMGPPQNRPSGTIRPAESAKVFKNSQFYKVGNSEFVTITLRVQLDKGLKDSTILLNAADALKFYADHGYHKTWTDHITLDKR